MNNWILLASLLLSVGCLPLKKTTTPSVDVRHAITIDSLQAITDLRYFASDERGGRGVTSEGNEAARSYIEARFRALGLKNKAESYRQSFAIGAKTATNVIGWVEGKSKSDSFIVISAHFDHLGTLNGQIYNGADDNASGSAGLLALATYFAKHQPQHSILFAAFDAEEQGLLGAQAFVRQPPIALAQMKVNLNMDMIGRNKDNTLNICGANLFPELKALVQPLTQNQPISFTFLHDLPSDRGAQNWVRASDHSAFNDKGIPFLYFGVEDHEGYHKITDDFERIMPQFFVNAIRFVQQVTLKIDEQ